MLWLFMNTRAYPRTILTSLLTAESWPASNAYTGDQDALDLLRAGICTVEEYAMQYRRKGKINAYDLLDPYIADYGPERTINQQHILHAMTGEPIFQTYAMKFEADMRRYISEE